MSAATLLRLWKVMTTVYITEQMVSTGHIISMAGTYSLQQTLFISVPALPSEKNWVVFAQGRPCAISILADDVVLDLNGFALAASISVAISESMNWIAWLATSGWPNWILVFA